MKLRKPSNFADPTPQRGQSRFHLTARPWSAWDISPEKYLEVIEGLGRFWQSQQDRRGAIIDPFLGREFQYATPYFAFSIGVLVRAGRAPDLLESGVRAMDHATKCFGKGRAGVPDLHGEFFLSALAGALELYEGRVPRKMMELWRRRMASPIHGMLSELANNWRTYAMKGEWLRAKAGLVGRENALAFIEESWAEAEQRDRIGGDRLNLYQDRQTNPESHAVEAVGRGNLLALIAAGYDGPASSEMASIVERGTETTLLLQDPSGQCPPGGRADNHVWNDVLYQLCFEVMAERAWRKGKTDLAGQYRRAAMLSFRSLKRWRRTDDSWKGSFFVTKNRIDPAERVGYQHASNYANYNAALMVHLAEAYLTRKSAIPEKPAPTEVGGYVVETDRRFATVAINAGGVQILASLRGDTRKVYDQYWSALGIERIGRVDWDTRLGPADGIREAKSGRGISFAPTWQENGKWIRMASVPERYEGQCRAQFVHPLLVRCVLEYRPRHETEPTFQQELVVTPDGVLAITRCSSGTVPFGVTWPLLENDGEQLLPRVTKNLATTAYGTHGDEQCFLSLQRGAVKRSREGLIRSSYGWLRPVRAIAVDGSNSTFVYPRSADDPAGEEVLAGFRVTSRGFQSPLGWVRGKLYAGRTSAGGEGAGIALKGEGRADITFDKVCQFMLQLCKGRIMAVETDRKAVARIDGRQILLEAHVPKNLADTPDGTPSVNSSKRQRREV